MQIAGFPLKAIIAAAAGGSFAIVLNMLALVLIGKINEKVQPDKRVSYFVWGSGIKKQFRQLYPDSKLLVVMRLCEAGLLLSFIFLIWALGVF